MPDLRWRRTQQPDVREEGRMKITGNTSTPWREHLPRDIRLCSVKGRMVYTDDGPRPDPARPREWIEVVRDGRVVFRSLRPLDRLKTVFTDGEKFYRVRRKSRESGVLHVNRKRIA